MVLLHVCVRTHTCTYMHIPGTCGPPLPSHTHTCTYIHIRTHTCTYMHIPGTCGPLPSLSASMRSLAPSTKHRSRSRRFRQSGHARWQWRGRVGSGLDAYVCMYVCIYVCMAMAWAGGLGPGASSRAATYIHTYVHTYIHKYIHTYIHTYIYA